LEFFNETHIIVAPLNYEKYMKEVINMKKLMRKILLPIFKKATNNYTRKLFFKIYTIYPFNYLYHFLVRYLTDSKDIVDVQGHKMFLDRIDTLNLSVRGIWEPFGTEVFKKHIKEGDTVLDLGAFIGYYTLIAAKLVGKKGKVYAFEPDPNNFVILKKNVELNGYKNVVLIQKAVSNENRKCRLYLSENNFGEHSIYGSKTGRKFIEIKSVKLDDIPIDKVNFIKMDIQGAEWSAIQGMSSILKRNKKLKIYTELDPFALRKAGVEPQEYLKLLIDNGFNLYNINELKQRLEPILTSKLPNKIYGAGINLLCLRY